MARPRPAGADLVAAADTSPPEHRQRGHAVRMDWGLVGARALVADARPGDVAVVVDVLSFTTTLCVALERGIEVLPHPWADGAEEYAAEHGAHLAVGRRAGLATGSVSLSPASFERAHGIERVVLPSPNGSTIAFALASAGVEVVGCCLRNAAAVAGWVAARVQTGATVSVVAAGERWPDGSLRPAVEDLWGAGALVAGLAGRGATRAASPEAEAAAAAYGAVADRMTDALPDCASGRELVARGFAADVAIAAAVDVTGVVPVWDGEVFRRPS
ncbi:MAG: 2-phosphosulfolactate phosphatase [Nocardioides sp.]